MRRLLLSLVALLPSALQADKATSVQVKNLAPEPLYLFWLPPSLPYQVRAAATVPPKTETSIGSFVGHVFLVSLSEDPGDALALGSDTSSFVALLPDSMQVDIRKEKDGLVAKYRDLPEHPVCMDAQARWPLTDTLSIPRVGFGTAAMGGTTVKTVQAALDAGLRLLDSAQAREWYDEAGVGVALSRAVERGVVDKKQDVFLTSKIHPRDFGYDEVVEAIEGSLRDLQVDTLDLMFLHFPRCMPHICGQTRTSDEDFVESFRAMADMLARGKLRSIGVSNVSTRDLEMLEDACIPDGDGGCLQPHIIQNWFDPFHADEDVRDYASEHYISYQGYSILGTQWRHRAGSAGVNPVLTHPIIQKLARRRRVSPAVLVLRWALSQGVLALCRSTNPEHIKQCAEVYHSFSDAPIDPEALERGDKSCATFTFDPTEILEVEALSGFLR